jgi:hypothetical protein
MPYGTYNTSLAAAERTKAMRMLRERRANKAEVFFSGGNDEGGIDDITVVRDDGARYKLEEHAEWRYEQQADGTWERVTVERTPEQIQESELFEILGLPVYERYSTFAGDFHVDGVVTWNVVENTVNMSGHEDVPSSESIGGSW